MRAPIFEIIAAAFFTGIVLTVFLLAAFIIIIRRRIKPRLDRKPDFLDKRPVRYGIIILALTGMTCILYGYLIEPNWLSITRLTITSPKIPDGKTIKIVHISDLHMESEGMRELKTPELVNSQQPDLIIITGDYLNSEKGRPYLANFLGKLKASHGIYAVRGNFEWRFKSDDIFTQQHIKLGNDEKITLNINGCLINLYLSNLGNAVPPLAQTDKYNIFVYHTPDLIPEAASAGFDLYLCGHTHGGQVRLPFYGALITFSKYGKRYEMGYYQEGRSFGSEPQGCGYANLMDAYVNRGLGMEGGIAPRVRFLARPEIAVITIGHSGSGNTDY